MANQAPQPDPSRGTRLFDLPEYSAAYARFVYQAINELMIRKDPVLSRIRSEPASSIPTSRNTAPSGEVVESPPIKLELAFAVDVKDAVAGSMESLVVGINNAA